MQVLNLSLDKVIAIKNKNQRSSLDEELTQLVDYHKKEGFEKVYLDYILPAPFNLLTNNEKHERS